MPERCAAGRGRRAGSLSCRAARRWPARRSTPREHARLREQTERPREPARPRSARAAGAARGIGAALARLDPQRALVGSCNSDFCGEEHGDRRLGPPARDRQREPARLTPGLRRGPQRYRWALPTRAWERFQSLTRPACRCASRSRTSALEPRGRREERRAAPAHRSGSRRTFRWPPCARCVRAGTATRAGDAAMILTPRLSSSTCTNRRHLRERGTARATCRAHQARASRAGLAYAREPRRVPVLGGGSQSLGVLRLLGQLPERAPHVGLEVSPRTGISTSQRPRSAAVSGRRRRHCSTADRATRGGIPQAR